MVVAQQAVGEIEQRRSVLSFDTMEVSLRTCYSLFTFSSLRISGFMFSFRSDRSIFRTFCQRVPKTPRSLRKERKNPEILTNLMRKRLTTRFRETLCEPGRWIDALKKRGRVLKKRGRVLQKRRLVRGTRGGPLLPQRGGVAS